MLPGVGDLDKIPKSIQDLKDMYKKKYSFDASMFNAKVHGTKYAAFSKHTMFHQVCMALRATTCSDQKTFAFSEQQQERIKKFMKERVGEAQFQQEAVPSEYIDTLEMINEDDVVLGNCLAVYILSYIDDSDSFDAEAIIQDLYSKNWSRPQGYYEQHISNLLAMVMAIVVLNSLRHNFTSDAFSANEDCTLYETSAFAFAYVGEDTDKRQSYSKVLAKDELNFGTATLGCFAKFIPKGIDIRHFVFFDKENTKDRAIPLDRATKYINSGPPSVRQYDHTRLELTVTKDLCLVIIPTSPTENNCATLSLTCDGATSKISDATKLLCSLTNLVPDFVMPIIESEDFCRTSIHVMIARLNAKSYTDPFSTKFKSFVDTWLGPEPETPQLFNPGDFVNGIMMAQKGSRMLQIKEHVFTACFSPFFNCIRSLFGDERTLTRTVLRSSLYDQRTVADADTATFTATFRHSPGALIELQNTGSEFPFACEHHGYDNKGVFIHISELVNLAATIVIKHYAKLTHGTYTLRIVTSEKVWTETASVSGADRQDMLTITLPDAVASSSSAAFLVFLEKVSVQETHITLTRELYSKFSLATNFESGQEHIDWKPIQQCFSDRGASEQFILNLQNYTSSLMSSCASEVSWQHAGETIRECLVRHLSPTTKFDDRGFETQLTFAFTDGNVNVLEAKIKDCVRDMIFTQQSMLVHMRFDYIRYVLCAAFSTLQLPEIFDPSNASALQLDLSLSGDNEEERKFLIAGLSGVDVDSQLQLLHHSCDHFLQGMGVSFSIDEYGDNYHATGTLSGSGNKILFTSKESDRTKEYFVVPNLPKATVLYAAIAVFVKLKGGTNVHPFELYTWLNRVEDCTDLLKQIVDAANVANVEPLGLASSSKESQTLSATVAQQWEDWKLEGIPKFTGFDTSEHVAKLKRVAVTLSDQKFDTDFESTIESVGLEKKECEVPDSAFLRTVCGPDGPKQWDKLCSTNMCCVFRWSAIKTKMQVGAGFFIGEKSGKHYMIIPRRLYGSNSSPDESPWILFTCVVRNDSANAVVMSMENALQLISNGYLHKFLGERLQFDFFVLESKKLADDRARAAQELPYDARVAHAKRPADTTPLSGKKHKP